MTNGKLSWCRPNGQANNKAIVYECLNCKEAVWRTKWCFLRPAHRPTWEPKKTCYSDKLKDRMNDWKCNSRIYAQIYP